MTDWLTRQAARTLETIPVLQPNLASRFSPVDSGEAIDWEESITSMIAPVTLADQPDDVSPSRQLPSSLSRSVPASAMPLTRVPRQRMRSPSLDPIATASESSISQTIESNSQTTHQSVILRDESSSIESNSIKIELDNVQPLIPPHSSGLPVNERSLPSSPNAISAIASPDKTLQNTPDPHHTLISNQVSRETPFATTHRHEGRSPSSESFSTDTLATEQNDRSLLVPHGSTQLSKNVNSTSKPVFYSEQTSSSQDHSLASNALALRLNSLFPNQSESLTHSGLELPNHEKKLDQKIVLSRPESTISEHTPLLSKTAFSHQSTPTIQVTIGRIEVRAASQPQPKQRSSAPPAPALSLKDYLKQRQGG